ncbi:MAG: hypothetical protein Q8Q01_03880 [archaeon]|nr:hypothetical protein [archaeon]
MNTIKYILQVVLMNAPAQAQEEMIFEPVDAFAISNTVKEANDALKALKAANAVSREKAKKVVPVASVVSTPAKKQKINLTAGESKRDNSNDVLRDDITGVINDLQFARNGVVELYRNGQIHQQAYDSLLKSVTIAHDGLSKLYSTRVFARAVESERFSIEKLFYEARIACIDLAFALTDKANGKQVKDLSSIEDVCAEKVAVYEAAKEKLSERMSSQNVAANAFNERDIFSGAVEAGTDTDNQVYVGFVGGWNLAKAGMEKLEILVGGRVYTNGTGDNSHKTVTQGNPDGSSSKLERDVIATNIDLTGDLRVRYVLGNDNGFHYAPVTGVRGHVNLSNEEINAKSSFTTPNGDVTLIPLNPEENSTVQTGAGFFLGVDGCYSRICVTPEFEL